VPIVRTPARRNAFGRIDEDAVIDVGVPHATEEESVVEEGWEGVDEDESYQEADECGMVREECGREDRGGGRGREERRRLEGASSPTPPAAASVVVAGHLAFFVCSRRDISTYLSASSSFGGTPRLEENVDFSRLTSHPKMQKMTFFQKINKEKLLTIKMYKMSSYLQQ
jgi:hypothetical protein